MKETILKLINEVRLDKTKLIQEESELIGDSRILDSFGLVELCIKLEDLAKTLGFDFDWTSSDAMSKSSSMFRTVKSLIEEFERQKKLNL